MHGLLISRLKVFCNIALYKPFLSILLIIFIYHLCLRVFRVVYRIFRTWLSLLTYMSGNAENLHKTTKNFRSQIMVSIMKDIWISITKGFSKWISCRKSLTRQTVYVDDVPPRGRSITARAEENTPAVSETFRRNTQPCQRRASRDLNIFTRKLKHLMEHLNLKPHKPR